MVNRTMYELLPAVYALGAVMTLAANDSMLRFFPASLLLFTAGIVIYMRYEFRHLPARERAERMAAKYRQRRAHHS